MGIGCVGYDLYSAEAVDGDNIKVILLQYCTDSEVGDEISEICVTARIVDGEAKFTSCHRSPGDVKYDDISKYES